ncbi:unnamed protein product [Paramecium sonneborni]|uniref:Uncharacterized protein n=1 Tax=Paramecium sonneborni TaxID=65129 RepID=A0A8S1Q9X7_9CILI|nr:unnamed protein product [Paramecium sonneborni]
MNQLSDIQKKYDEKIKDFATQIRFIKSNTNIENYFQNINQPSRIILFLGFRLNVFEQYIDNLERKSLKYHGEFITIYEIKQNGKDYFFINSPHSLLFYQNLNNFQKICASKIILEQILLTFKKPIHVIINYTQILGNDSKEKQEMLLSLEFLKFGKVQLKEQKISFIEEIYDRQNYVYLKSLNPNNQIQFKSLRKEEIIKSIIKNDDFVNIKQVELPQDISYGAMTVTMSKLQEKLIKIINKTIENFQQQLYYLQQIPKLDEEQDLNNSIKRYLQNVNDQIKYEQKPLLEHVDQIFDKINQVNQNSGNELNQNLKKLNRLYFDVFLKDIKQTFEDMEIKQFQLNLNQISQIQEFLLRYHKHQFKNVVIITIQNLVLNVSFWNQFSHILLENKLYQMKQISHSVQSEPQGEGMNKGVFFFGKSRVGKSTLINLIQDHKCLTVEKQYVIYVINNAVFKIEHGCMSETQKISGLRIDDIWYFDCPGFDDNISEYARIAHRISLYNYLKKFRSIVGFLVIDGSIRDAQIIKDSIDPIYLLIEDKHQLQIEHNKWLSLILVKTKPNTRRDYIENWQNAYHGLLEGKYSFYQQMYQNDNSCIDFQKSKGKPQLPDQQTIENYLLGVKNQIINIVQNQLQNRDRISLKFELYMETKLFYLIEVGITMLKHKIEQILFNLSNQLNFYILYNRDNIENKQKVIEQLLKFLEDEINQNNVGGFLNNLQNWSNENQEFGDKNKFLSMLIDDILSCLKLLKYCKNRQIAPIQIKTETIKKNMNQAISYIKTIINTYSGLQIAFGISTVIITIATLGFALIAEGALTALAATALRTGITSAGGGFVTGTLGISVEIFQKGILSHYYRNYLEEQQKK